MAPVAVATRGAARRSAPARRRAARRPRDARRQLHVVVGGAGSGSRSCLVRRSMRGQRRRRGDVAESRVIAIAVIAIAERGAMFAPGPVAFYVDKIARRPVEAGHVKFAVPDGERARHRQGEAQGGGGRGAPFWTANDTWGSSRLRLAGARIKLIADGGVEAALASATQSSECTRSSGPPAPRAPSGGRRGGRCAGGEMQAQLWHGTPRTRRQCAPLAATSRACFARRTCAGGGSVRRHGRLRRPRARRRARRSGGARSSSLVMRFPSRTVRQIETEHTWLGEGRPAVAKLAGRRRRTSAYTTRGSTLHQRVRRRAFLPEGERPTDETRLKNEKRG